MKKTLMRTLVLVSLVLFATGCTTVSYSAGRSYVGFATDGVKSVQQTKKTSFSDDALYSTYDDEFVYDEDGNVIKHIQTQYFDNGAKYDEYVVVYQKIGGNILPESVAINGVVYMEVEYDILSADHEGKIKEASSTPEIAQNFRNYILFVNQNINWNIDIENFDVPFRSDGKFVSTEESLSFYTGLSMDKVLTLGYDNIVIKRFYHSPSKYRAGYNLSVDSLSSEMEEIIDDESRNTTFTFEWDVVAGEIVQKGMTLKENMRGDYLEFFIERDYDNSGRRISEIWNVIDSESKSGEPVMLFEQKLNY